MRRAAPLPMIHGKTSTPTRGEDHFVSRKSSAENTQCPSHEVVSIGDIARLFAQGKQHVMAKTKRSTRTSSTSLLDQLSSSTSALILLAIIGLALYGQTMSFTIGKFDEDVIITFNEKLLKNPDNVFEVLQRDAFFNNPGRNFYRPTQNLSIFLDTQIGKGKPWAYYLTNILLHIATCWLLFRTLKDLQFRPSTALGTTLLYATTPLFVHVIAWIPGRGDLLIAMFTLLCLRATFRYLDTGKVSTLIFLHVCFFLSMFSKETSVLIPIIITAAWWMLYPRRAETAKTLALTLLPCLIPVVLWFIARSMVIPKYPDATVFGIIPFLNNLRAIPETISKFLVPIGLAPLPAFSWLVTGLGSVIAIGLVVAALRRATDTERKLTLFGIGWFLLFSAPGVAYTNELGKIAYDYLEHRAYLPMIGMVIVGTVILGRLMDGRRRATVSMVLLGVVAFYGVFSFTRAKNYKTAAAFYDMAIEGNPRSGMSYLNRGYLRAISSDLKGAEADYTSAMTYCPEYAEAYVNRGVLYQNIQREADAGNDFKQAVLRNPELFAAHYNMANWYSRREDLANALTHYRRSMELKPNFGEGWAMIASIIAKQGDLTSALPYFEKALTIEPGLMVAYVNRGKAFYNVGRSSEACADWRQASALGSAEGSQLVQALCK
jgi:Flp pilus assembly protein TadD